VQLLKAQAQLGARSYGATRTIEGRLQILPWDNVKDAPSALSSANTALKSFESSGDKAGMGTALLAIAKAHLVLKQEKQAMMDAQKALTLFNEIGDDSGEGAAWELLSDIRFWMSASDSGKTAACAAMSLYMEAGDVAGEARVLLALADQAGRYMEAGLNMPTSAGETLSSAAKALAQFQKSGSHKLEVIALDLVVKAQCALGQIVEATQAAKQSIATLHRLGKKKYEALAMLSLAHAHAADGWLSEALEVAQSALVASQSIKDTIAQACALLCLAKLKFSDSQLESALEDATNAVKVLQGTEDSTVYGATELLSKIKSAIEKNPGLQEELERKKQLQHELELETLNEVVEALQLRKVNDFQEKYSKLDECMSLSADEINAALAPVVQADYENTQKWISEALKTKSQTHTYNHREYCYALTRYGGMHYGPGFRLITTFGCTPKDNPYFTMYAAMQCHNMVREAEWELHMCYHPPMYDCGLQCQMSAETAPTLSAQHDLWKYYKSETP
jgi:tetratricopeptide (TPR) repeat protein